MSPRTGEVVAAALSAAVRSVLLYRSLVESIEEVAEASSGPIWFQLYFLRQREVATVALLPVQVEFLHDSGLTSLRVVAEDTPFFLFSLATSLSVGGISIERVQIATEG